MKIHVFSDVHNEINNVLTMRKRTDPDLVVVAGDISNSAEGAVDWLLRNTPENIPCVFVAGNHEFYGNQFPGEIDKLRELSSREDRLIFLENDVTVLDGVRFIGATLWTDYDLFGNRTLCMHSANSQLNDHRYISCGSGRFLPQTARETHLLSRGFILNNLLRPFDGKSVVITHHCPHPRSVHPKYGTDPINAAFCSDLSSIIQNGQPDLWIHGHTHNSFDYILPTDTGCRVVCNPIGYGNENPDFDPNLIVDI